MPMQCRWLTGEEIRALVSAGDLVPVMESALRAFSAGGVVQPPRTTLWVGEDRAFCGLMPAYVPEGSALGSKLVTYFTGNRARGLPTHFATILLLDPTTGAPLAVLDGAFITQVRTAAVSVVAARYLAAAPVRRMAVFGCGVQAEGHLRAFSEQVSSLEEVRVWSPFDELAAFVDEVASRVRPAVRAAASGEAAVRGADLIVTVTSSPEPVVCARWIAEGALVISVGACRPEHRELDDELTATSRLVVDSREAAVTESGDIMRAIADGVVSADQLAELGEIIAGRQQARQRPHQVVVFKSLGLAVEDVTAAQLAYRLALAQRVGTELPL